MQWLAEFVSRRGGALITLGGRSVYAAGQYQVTGPQGQTHLPPRGRYWAVSEERFKELDADNRIWWGSKGDGV